MDKSFEDKIALEIEAQLVSGRTIALESGPYRALIDRQGAAIQGLWWTPSEGAAEIPLTEPYGAESPFTCGQTLIPWPNRIADAQFLFQETPVSLEMSEPALRNAIHGLATAALWDVSEKAADGSFVTLSFRSGPTLGNGWPWEFSVEVRYEVSAAGLTVAVSVINESRQEMPWGYGAHPYITAGGAALDTCTLEASVDEWWVTDDRNLPTGEHLPVGEGVPALRQPTSMEGVWFDTPFTVAKDTPVDVGWRELARLIGPAAEDQNISVVMDTDSGFTWLQIFTTGEKTVMFPGKDAEEGRALAVEPMTCPPNAMVTGQDVIVLQPLAEWSGQWRLHGEVSDRL